VTHLTSRVAQAEGSVAGEFLESGYTSQPAPQRAASDEVPAGGESVSASRKGHPISALEMALWFGMAARCSVDTGSSAVEDYLKAIYSLQDEGEAVSTTVLAQRLCVTAASVTGMLKRLAAEEPALVNYTRYQGVSLTPAGERLALRILRRHRLLELFLQRALHYTWDEVHAEADRLEHVISETFEDRMAAWLDQPAVDPHGHPIPSKGGTLAAPAGRKLSQLSAGERGRVASVSDQNPALLRYLAETGLVPGVVVSVAERVPFGGPMLIKIGERPPEPMGDEITDSVTVLTLPALEAERSSLDREPEGP